MADSTVTIIGNLTRTPELRYLTNGTAVCTIGVAVNRRFQRNGEWEEEVSFFDVTCWRDLADNVAESVDKGDRVIVTGRLEQRRWENAEGETRTKVEIVADDVGPALRWAVASPKRVKPASNGGSGGGGSDDRVPDAAYEEQF